MVAVALVCLVGVVTPPAGAVGTGVFTAHPTAPSFGTGSSTGVALGDLDDDGDLDAVVANDDGAAETVWLNNGAGVFTAHPTAPAFGAGDSDGLALGDLDGDGDLDAVVANDDGEAETVWLNGGAGAFTAHPTTSSFGAGDSKGVALGDLDGDGDLDAVVANHNGQAETVWLNGGTGVFTAHPTAPSFGIGFSLGLALGDLDGDGDLDAVVENAFGEAETVWLNNGTGVFTAHPTTPSFGAGESLEVALGDLDGDGDVDAVVANTGSQSETVWLNDGAGVFTAHPTTPSFGADDSFGVALGDLDGDGDLDAVVANFGGQAERVWVNATAPTLSIDDVTMLEGDAGTQGFTFTITRSGFVSIASSVTWSTADGSAVAPGDYTAVGPTTVNFAAGETTKTVSVTVNGDTSVEANDGFTVNLANPVNAAIGDGTGVGRITNDDAAAFSVGDATVTEGDSGTALATFTVSRTGTTGSAATVQWFTQAGTATAGEDFVAVAPTTLSFAGGETTRTVSVTINGDTAVEANETFVVRLASPAGASMADGSGLGRITNDDYAAFSVNDGTVNEGNTGTTTATFTVTRAGATGGTATVQWSTADGTATAAGGDYLAVPATTLSFGPGETSKAISVTVNGDTAREPNETVQVRLTGPVGASLVDPSGLGRITNDD